MAEAGIGGMQQVEIFMACRNLKDLDVMSKSDPFVQHLSFAVYDYDGPGQQELIGSCETTVHSIMGAANQTLISELKDSNGRITGKIILRGEEVVSCNDKVFLELNASKIDNVEFWSKSDPFLIFYRCREDGTWVRVHATEYLKNNLNPRWAPFTLSVQSLCNGDYMRPIRIEIYDWEKDGDHEFIGACEANLQAILDKPAEGFPFINPKKAKKRKYKNSGILHISRVQIIQEPSFLQYIQGNCHMRLLVAIDFTASNGIPTNPQSLHFVNPQGLNDYEKAIWAVGDILINYDTTKSVPVWGFGGAPAKGMPTSHCFPLNGNPSNPEVVGVQGILQVYRHVLQSVYLNGPTLFSHIIQNAIQIASQPWPPGQQLYNILLILTDGEIHDMRETTELIVQASNLPLSIIIIGVGNATFDNMETLDSDDQLLRDHRGRQAVRDIVQFVPFKKFEGNPYILAKEVLQEVPEQLTGFMKSQGIAPIPMQHVNMADINIPPPITTNNPDNFNLTTPMLRGFGNIVNVQLPSGQTVSIQQDQQGQQYIQHTSTQQAPGLNQAFTTPPPPGHQSVGQPIPPQPQQRGTFGFGRFNPQN